MTTRRYSPVGVSICGGVVRAVQLERRSGGWAVRDAVTLPSRGFNEEFGPQAAKRLAEVWRRRRFVGREVVLALPNPNLIRGLIEVDADSAETLMEAAVETERVHGLSPGTYELTAWQPEQPGESRRVPVMVQGCSHEAAQRWVEVLAGVGLTVARIDSRASALVPVVSPDEPSESVHAVLDLGLDTVELVLSRGGSLIYQRALPDAGLRQVLQKLNEDGLDEELARHVLTTIGLASEVERSDQACGAVARKALSQYAKRVLREAEPALDYAARVYAPWTIGTLTLVADGAAVPGLEADLGRRLGLSPRPVRRGDVSGLHGQGAYAVPLGLCLAEVTAPDTSINLLPSATIDSRERSRTTRRGLVGVVGYAAVLALGVMIYLGVNRPQSAVAASTQLVSAQEEAASLEQSLADVRRATADAARRLAGSRVLSERPDWSTLLRLIEQNIGPEVVLDDLRVSITGETIGTTADVTIRGAAQDPWALSTFVLSLEQVGLFDRVSIQRSQRAPRLAVTVTEFTLQCSIGKEGDEESHD